MTQAQLAKRIGVTRGALANWEVGGDVSRANMRRISEEFDGTLDWLETGMGKPPAIVEIRTLAPSAKRDDTEGVGYLGTAPNARIEQKSMSGWREVPVYGQAVAGEDGEFLMNGNILFTALAPPSVVAVSNAYGVRVAGVSMEPRYYDGEVVFVDPSRIPRAGDFVVVQVKTDEHGELWGFVKRYVRRNTKELVLSQFNPEKELRFPNDQVASCHVIVMGGMG